MIKIEKGTKVKIYCLSDKPEGTITNIKKSPDGDIITVELANAIITVDESDIIEDSGMLQVLNFIDIKKDPEPKPITNPDETKFNSTIDRLRPSIPDTKDLYELLQYFSSAFIDDGRLFPYPCLFNIGKQKIGFVEKEGIAVTGFSCPDANTVYTMALGIMATTKPKELLFGVDHKNIPNSGIKAKYKHVLCVYFNKDSVWKYGVIGYNNKEDLLDQDLDWNNTFWSNKMKLNLLGIQDENIAIKAGTAYNNRIDIDVWQENEDGFFYEGKILVDKLDDKTQKFLKKNKLDINNYDEVIEFFKKKNMPIEFMNMNDGPFTSIMVSNTGLLFMDRRSKTRAILEAIESIANNTKLIPKVDVL